MSYVSDLQGHVVIDDSNAEQFIEKESGFLERDWTEDPFGEVPCALAQQKVHDRATWKERIRAMEKTKSRVSDFCAQHKIPFKNQARTNYCASNATVGAMIISRVVQGQDFVDLSPASLGGPVTNYANANGNPAGVGHWPIKVAKFLAQHGAVPTEFWPDNAINRKYDTPANQARRAKFRAIEWADLTRFSFPELMSALMDRKPVATVFMWMKHVVLSVDPVILDGTNRFGVRYRQSYGPKWQGSGYGILTEERAKPDEAIAPVVLIAD